MNLKNLKGLKIEEIDRLSKNWITTSEGFAAIYLNEELNKNLQQLLEVDGERYNEIGNLILQSIPEVQLDQIKYFKNPQHKTGAKKP